MTPAAQIRLNKFISDSGYCSRREADKLIERGKVFVNKGRAAIGDSVRPGDKVYVNGQLIESAAEDLIIALNKPVGITSTTEKSIAGNIISFVNHSQRIFPIGRLDKDSQGLILLTNNGDLVNRILRAGNRHEKEYVVTVDKPITQAFLDGMAGGVPLLGTVTLRCKVEKETPFIFRITLTQGLNRQIRRMCSHFGYEVVKLERIRIMNITLKGLPLGDWRNLDDDETKTLMKMLEGSSSTPRKERSFSKNKQSRRARQNAPKGGGDKEATRLGRAQKPRQGKSHDPAKPKTGKATKSGGRSSASPRRETTGGKPKRPAQRGKKTGQKGR